MQSVQSQQAGITATVARHCRRKEAPGCQVSAESPSQACPGPHEGLPINPADPQVWLGWDPQEGEIRQTLGPEGQSTGEGHGSLGGGQSRTPRTEPRGVRWGNAPQGSATPTPS